MSHRSIEASSPRYSVVLELSDTLLCLGQAATRTRNSQAHVLTAPDCTVEVFTPYSITLRIDGRKVFKARNAYEAKKQLMSAFIRD